MKFSTWAYAIMQIQEAGVQVQVGVMDNFFSVIP